MQAARPLLRCTLTDCPDLCAQARVPAPRPANFPLDQAQLKPWVWSGSERTRLPVAVKIAFVSAGIIGGNAGSPRPVGGWSDFRNATSISGGACVRRTAG